MKRFWTLLVISTACWCASASGDITIVVNMGKYSSAESAAGDEANVNWRDVDAMDDTVCTECFAAMDLKRYLEKMRGEQSPLWVMRRRRRAI